MPASHTVTWQRWQECSICGLDYPISRLTRQDGVLVCTSTCVDVRDHPGESKVEGNSLDEIKLPDIYEIWD